MKPGVNDKEEFKKEMFAKGNADALFKTFANGKPLDNIINKTEITGQLTNGPLSKNQYTILFEELILALLENQNVKFTKIKDKIIVDLGYKRLILNEIMQKINVQQIQILSPNAHQQYLDFLYSEAKRKPAVPSLANAPKQWLESKRQGALKELEISEIAAINIYTQSYYKQMNAMLRNAPHADFDSQNEKFQQNMKEVLLHIGMAFSGLNRIQDVDVGTSFRYEDDNLPQSILDERIKSVHSDVKNPYVTFEHGFVSSSMEKPASSFEGTYATVFKGLKGKPISTISYFSTEREFLMNPSQIRWICHEQVNKSHFFLAKPVYTLNGLETANDDSAFAALKAHNVKDTESIFKPIAEELTNDLLTCSKKFNDTLQVMIKVISPDDIHNTNLYNRLSARITQTQNLINSIEAIASQKLKSRLTIDRILLNVNDLIHDLTEYEKKSNQKSTLKSNLLVIINKTKEAMYNITKNDKYMTSKIDNQILPNEDTKPMNAVPTQPKIEPVEAPLSQKKVTNQPAAPAPVEPVLQFSKMGPKANVVDSQPTAAKPPTIASAQNSENYLRTPHGKHAIEFVNAEYLCKPFNAELKKFCGIDWELNYSKGKINRPNHGLAHTLRVVSIIPVLANFLMKNNPVMFGGLNQDYIQKAQHIMLFSVVGRGNEITWNKSCQLKESKIYPKPEDANQNAMYDQFKQIAQEAFLKHVNLNPSNMFPPQELPFWVEFIDVGKPSNVSPIGILMQIAHDLDLMRCYSTEQFDAKIDVLTKHLGGNANDAMEIVNYMRQLQLATGNRIMAGGEYIPYNTEIFAQCSTNYNACLDRIDSVTKPIPNPNAKMQNKFKP